MERDGEINMILILILVAIILIIAISKWARNLGDEGAPEDDSYEYRNASAAYLQAQQNFDEADSEFIDVAICDVCSSEMRVNSELWKIRNRDIGPDTWKWITLACDGDLQHPYRITATLEIAVAGYERW